MPSADNSAIDRFIAQVKSESKMHGDHGANSVFIRMTLQEAQALSLEIAAVMNKNHLRSENVNFSISADGGSLR